MFENTLAGHFLDRNISLKLNKVEITNPKIREELHGFTILHLTDMHFNGKEDLVHRLADEVRGLNVDMIAMTGDYHKGDKKYCNCEKLTKQLMFVLNGVTTSFGTFATLGNHDPDELHSHLTSSGIHVLRDQTCDIRIPNRSKQNNATQNVKLVASNDNNKNEVFAPDSEISAPAKLRVTGLDYATCKLPSKRMHIARAHRDHFSLVLAHSPRAAHAMAMRDYDLYLTGHTHGGQIRPLMHTHTVQDELSRAYGLWTESQMTGYTSCGVGTSGLPIRVQSQAEVTLFTLKAC